MGTVGGISLSGLYKRDNVEILKKQMLLSGDDNGTVHLLHHGRAACQLMNSKWTGNAKEGTVQRVMFLEKQIVY